jgi:Nucleotidyltransferase of unknown function (DUF6036)
MSAGLRLFKPTELRIFLEALDAALTHPTRVLVIGGAAAALQYGVEVGTTDIDTWTWVDPTLAAAVHSAAQTTALAVPFQHSAVADGPIDFESRVERALPDLRRLAVTVPEKHDLALMKVIRGRIRDIDVIAALHARSPLNPTVLVNRYLTEMGAVVAEPNTLRENVLLLVQRLFPAQMPEISERLRKHRWGWQELEDLVDRSAGPHRKGRGRLP